MIFTKMQGAGNDFIILDNRENILPHEKLSTVAARLCSRRRSIGADGMMVIENSDLPSADYRMIFFNSDGSLGEMCGNGARCICRYGYEYGLAGETQHVETTAGLVTGTRITAREYRVRLNDMTVLDLHRPAEACGKIYDTAYAELGCPGLPHASVRIPGLQEMDMETLRPLGAALRRNKAYPKGANINFYDVIGENHLCIRTYERGVEDFTLACGTGTGVTVCVSGLLGLLSADNASADMPGGTLRITADLSGKLPKDIFLTGPTCIVARGEILDEELSL